MGAQHDYGLNPRTFQLKPLTDLAIPAGFRNDHQFMNSLPADIEFRRTAYLVEDTHFGDFFYQYRKSLYSSCSLELCNQYIHAVWGFHTPHGFVMPF